MLVNAENVMHNVILVEGQVIDSIVENEQRLILSLLSLLLNELLFTSDTEMPRPTTNY
jgi:hypothetical protein